MVVVAVRQYMETQAVDLEAMVRAEVEKQVRILYEQVTEKRVPGRPPKRAKVPPICPDPNDSILL